MSETVNPVDYVVTDITIRVRIPIVECERCKKREPMVPASVRVDQTGKPEWLTDYSRDPAGWAWAGDWYLCGDCVAAAKAFMEKREFGG